MKKTKKDLLQEIDEIYKECKEDNWDEEGAKGLDIESVNNAKDFVELL